MKWLKELIKKLFFRNNIKQLEAPKNIEKNEENTFKIMLKRQSNVEADDGNGYKIKPNIILKEMI